MAPDVEKTRNNWALMPEEVRQRLLDEAFSLIKTDPFAAGLLALAQKDGIKIGFDADLIGEAAAAYYDYSGKNIYLCPLSKTGKVFSAKKLASYLVHELRHHEQYRHIGVAPEEVYKMDPRMAFMWSRVIEADAYAVQFDFEHRLNGEKSDLSELFTRVLKNTKARETYDPVRAQFICHENALIIAGRSVKPPKELRIDDLRAILKTGQGPHGYLDGLTDRAFTALVLKDADRDAFHAVRLMEKFRKAVANNDEPKQVATAGRLLEKMQQLNAMGAR